MISGNPFSLKSILAAVAVTVIVYGASAFSAAAEKRPAGENGYERCVIENDGGDPISVDSKSNRCCYEDDLGGGESVTMCVECDKDWKNCTEAPGSPKIRLNSLPSRSNGTITEPTGTTGAGRTTTTTGGGTKLDN